MSGTRRPSTPLVWLGLLLLAYLAVPLVAFLVRAAGPGDHGFSQPGIWDALRTSVTAASIATLLVAVVGIPLAYRLARRPGRLTSLVGLAVQLPLALPPVMAGVVLLYLIGPYTTVGRFFHGRLTDTLAGVVIAQSFVASPFLVVAARSAFAAADPALEDVAATLGLGPTARFFRIALPAAAPGIRAGLLLTWLRGFGEYGATVLLAYHPYSLPVFTYVQFSGAGIPTTQAPTLLAIGVAAVVVALGHLRLPSPHRTRHRRPSTQRPDTALSAAATALGHRTRPPGPLAPTPVTFALDFVVGDFRLRSAFRATSPRIAIIGPSGSGKSMTLRALAGLLGDGVGPVTYAGRDVARVRTESRHIGYVPQSPALLAGRTVWEHVTLARDADTAVAEWWLGALHLDDLADRRPAQLSGGQQQRVLLAQALARQPTLLLLDEPFSALDAPVREELRRELRRLQREVGLSTVLVTHDPVEAALLADEILVLAGGRLLQAGPRAEVFGYPASAEVGRLLGVVNLHSARLGSPTEIQWGDATIAWNPPPIPDHRVPTRAGEEILWTVDPDRLVVHPDAPDPRRGPIRPALVLDVADLGTTTVIDIELRGAGVLRARTPTPPALSPGDPCWVEIPIGASRAWPAATSPEA